MSGKEQTKFELNFDTNGNTKQMFAMNALLNDDEMWNIGYGGGAGGGKSWLIVAWSWIMCMKYPGVKGFWARRELKELRNSTLQTYYKFCEVHNIPKQLRGTFRMLDSKIVFHNGSEIALIELSHSPQDPEYSRFGSTEYTFGAIDEAQDVPEKAVEIISTRVGRWKNLEYNIRGKVIETFNPDKGHVYRRFYKPWRDSRVDDFVFYEEINADGEIIKLKKAFIPAVLTDNKTYAYKSDGSKSDYYIKLLSSPERTKQRLLFGNFDYDDTPGRLFDYVSVLKMKERKRSGGDGYIVVDVARAGKDKTEIMVWEGLDIVERIFEKKSKMDELADRVREIARRKGIPMSRVIADENGVGGGLVDNLRCVGFVSTRTQIGKSKAHNYQNLKAQVVHTASTFVNNRLVGWHVNDDDAFGVLVEDLDSFMQINIDDDSKFSIIKKDEQKAKLGRSPDLGDCFIMRFYFEVGKNEREFSVVQGKESESVYAITITNDRDDPNKLNFDGPMLERKPVEKEGLVDMGMPADIYST